MVGLRWRRSDDGSRGLLSGPPVRGTPLGVAAEGGCGLKSLRSWWLSWWCFGGDDGGGVWWLRRQGGELKGSQPGCCSLSVSDLLKKCCCWRCHHGSWCYLLWLVLSVVGAVLQGL